MGEQAFASWSGGKDCSLALYRAATEGIQIRYLLNMVSEDGTQSRSHGVSAKLLQMQSEAMGIPIVQKRTDKHSYEALYKEVLADFRQEGITTGIFGDIDFNAHREWIDRVCGDAGIVPRFPLWEENQDKLLKEFIDDGFEAVVVATRADLLAEEWLGRKIDATFQAEINRIPGITMCGEAGEYHSLVLTGPTFRKRLNIKNAGKVLREGRWFLEIGECCT